MPVFRDGAVSVPAAIAQQHGQILDAAIELFARRGYHATTTREVAIRAKVSIGSVARFAGSKEHLLFLCLLHLLEACQRAIAPALSGAADPRRRLDAAAVGYCQAIGAQRDGIMLRYRENQWLSRERRELVNAKELELSKLFAALIEDCRTAGVLAAADVEMLAYQLLAYCHAWVLDSWRLQPPLSAPQYVERGLRALLGPSTANAGPPGK